MPSFVVSSPACSASAHPSGSACDRGECAYKVAWSINPHMVVGGADSVAAVSQHAAFLAALRVAGATLIELPFVHGAYDSVFAKDTAILATSRSQRRALLATPHHAERKQEQAPRRRALEACGFNTCHSISPLEGGAVVVPGRDLVLLGHGFRSTRGAAKILDRFLEAEVVPIELVDPALYHLDTALTVLNDGTLVYCKDAFTAAAQRELSSRFSNRIEVARAEALRFALNLVEVGADIVTGTDSLLCDTLRSMGRRVTVTPLDQFQRAGGSAACHVAELHPLDATSHALAA